MRILFTGGGSGGHIFPIIAVKSAFGQGVGFNFYYLGPNGFAKKNLENLNINTKFISAGKFRRYFSLFIIIDLIQIFIGIFQSFWYLFKWMPDLIFSKGGYGSFPVVLVAWIYRIPVILHDSDSVPGLANKILAKFAKKIILSFPGSEKYFNKHQKKIKLIGNPVRQELNQGNKEEARTLFKINLQKPVILIIGGSQGAEKINEIVLNTLTRLLEVAEIIHISGEKNFFLVQSESNKILKSCSVLEKNYHLFPFLDIENLKHAYAIADLVVHRSGAGSIFEIAYCGKASILIPISKSAQDHQRKNAYEFAKENRAIVLEQENLSPNIFLKKISDLLSNSNQLQEMQKKAKSFYNPNTSGLIVKELLNLK